MQNNNSIWTKTSERLNFDSLEGDIKADVLIVGGGITGILCAYMLKCAGVSAVLVEATRICNGITKNTTAKITLQHGLIYDKIIRRYGLDTARLYYQSQREAIDKYRALCNNIPCGYEERPSYVYSLKAGSKIEAEAAALDKIGCPCTVTSKLSLPFSVASAVGIEGQAQFHPLEFLFALAKELTVYENTKVLEIGPRIAVTDRGKISYDKMIVATHFPILNKHGGYFLKLYQHRSYVMALENAPAVDGMYVCEDTGGISFRSYNDILIIGSGGHRTGKQGRGWADLEGFSKRYYGSAREVARWATQDCMTLDGMPYIGKYSEATDNLYVATGFNKWGMSCAMTAASLLTDMIQGRKNDYQRIFSPGRSVWHLQLAINAAESLIGLATPTVPRCPHLGCALKYNPHEHSWDCPCHGSRFTEDGQLIDNPATDDKRR